MNRYLSALTELWTQLQWKVEDLGEEVRDRLEGQTMVEYAFMIVFVAVAAIVALMAVGTSIGDLFTSIAACVADPSVANCPW